MVLEIVFRKIRKKCCFCRTEFNSILFWRFYFVIPCSDGSCVGGVKNALTDAFKFCLSSEM